MNSNKLVDQRYEIEEEKVQNLSEYNDGHSFNLDVVAKSKNSFVIRKTRDQSHFDENTLFLFPTGTPFRLGDRRKCTVP